MTILFSAFRNGPMTRQRLRRTLPLLFGLGLFALGLWALYHSRPSCFQTKGKYHLQTTLSEALKTT